MKNKILCSLCSQTKDIYTDVCKNKPFVDGKLYPKLCFTCFFVPKTIEQIYDSKGLIKEEIPLSYSCENLHSAKELYSQGSAESLKQAKKSLESVQGSCKSCKKIKEVKKQNPNWILK
jgi:hypothetical protein